MMGLIVQDYRELEPAEQVSYWKGVFMNLTKFGAFIVSLREESGITQKELAKRVGVKTKLIAMWEKGVCPPRADKVSELACALGVQPIELLLSERIQDETNTKNALEVYEEISAYQLRTEVKCRRVQLVVATILAITLGVFLIDNFTLVLFIAVIVPILAVICFMSSIVYYFMFRYTNRKSSLPIAVGIISFFIFTSILCLFVFAFWIGGPAPT